MTPEDAMRRACEAGSLPDIRTAAAKGASAYAYPNLVVLAARGGDDLGETLEWIAADHAARGLTPGPGAGIYPADHEGRAALAPDGEGVDPLIHFGCLAADARAIRAMAEIGRAGGVAPGESLSTPGAWGLTGPDYLMYGNGAKKHPPERIRDAIDAALEVGGPHLDAGDRTRLERARNELTNAPETGPIESAAPGVRSVPPTHGRANGREAGPDVGP